MVSVYCVFVFVIDLYGGLSKKVLLLVYLSCEQNLNSDLQNSSYLINFGCLIVAAWLLDYMIDDPP